MKRIRKWAQVGDQHVLVQATRNRCYPSREGLRPQHRWGLGICCAPTKRICRDFLESRWRNRPTVHGKMPLAGWRFIASAVREIVAQIRASRAVAVITVTGRTPELTRAYRWLKRLGFDGHPTTGWQLRTQDLWYPGFLDAVWGKSE